MLVLLLAESRIQARALGPRAEKWLHKGVGRGLELSGERVQRLDGEFERATSSTFKAYVLGSGTALAFDDDIDREVSFLSILLICSLTNRA